ncbi:DUF397 domain-containing protein [Actinophytocola oryzae]|uniref:DUF397 domain-containing protein n=1 Tax=Actinophytocola oryzae TaxID=502181 RepID=UPI001064393B
MTWKKSSFTNTDNCVELRCHTAAIRDSKHPQAVMPVSRTALAQLTMFVQVEPSGACRRG